MRSRLLEVELQVGDPAPEFEATNDAGEIWKSAEHVGKRWVVVYFHPGDFTPGCTRKLKSFARTLERCRTRSRGRRVSGDSVTIHERFKKDFELNYTLLADEQGDIATKFGVPVRRQARSGPASRTGS